MAHRIAVGVSGTGSNLRALHAAAERGALDAEIAVVFADRECPAIDWAVEQGMDTLVVPIPKLSQAAERASANEVLAESLAAVGPELIVLAGYMRVLGPAAIGGLKCPIVNLHPALLPAFPGAHAVRDALAAGVKVTGVTVHFVDGSLDGGPIIVQDAVPVLEGDTEATLLERIHAVEHRLLPRAVGLALAGGLAIGADGRAVRIDAARAARTIPTPRRALLAPYDKTGLPEFAAGLVRLGFELVSTGRTAQVLRGAGLPVTDVAAMTGFPEMLDGRVKTLHPRVHAGLLADRRLESHREQLAAAGIEPFELVVAGLYPFAETVERPGVTLDEIIEQIDIGGPSMIRAAAKNHANVAIVVSPARYGAVLAALERDGRLDDGFRSALAIEAFRHTAAYDARIAAELPGRMAAAGVALPDEPGLPGCADPYPPTLVVGLEKVETLRYGENPHQQAARYRRPGTSKWAGPFALGGTILQGKALSYNNVLDASGADALGRALRGPAVVIVKHTNPCGAAERATLAEAWRDALAGDPVSAYGGVVALTREVDAATAEQMAAIFLEVIVAPSYSAEA
ncbi:MAG: bifunctional phosphoribosylaminoimidazolecarboxamide formyltransferase/IMP cyclohydrolase, partial [Candidatus Limnocylindrales bacterium]